MIKDLKAKTPLVVITITPNPIKIFKRLFSDVTTVLEGLGSGVSGFGVEVGVAVGVFVGEGIGVGVGARPEGEA